MNGQKVFITNGWDCDLAIVVCKTGNSPRMHHNLSIIVIEEGTPGFIKAKKMEKMGRHAEGTGELVFEDCRVPQRNLLGEEGKGFYYMMEKLQQERLIAALGSLTAAEKMFEEGLEYAKTRKAFGQPIGKFQHNSFKLAEMATEIEIARCFVHELVSEHVAGKDIVNKVSMAKWWVSEMANRVAYDSLQLHGGYGYMEEYPISRHYQNVRVDTIFAGTTEIMKSIIAKNLGL
ncbi:acyl-CoA dehydrogenase family protein [Brevibacillus fluminis]|uniref:acyl-CoA dehydrogenase family protein n=1 Tax=Brevibacillus fluminis TaxID=511487 RepID=UPI0024826BE0|nr:acyl-CoA dehydrogenase family protein [Brevibacillus fluminis]